MAQPYLMSSECIVENYDHISDDDESYPYFGNHDKDLAECIQRDGIKILQIYGPLYIGKTRLAKSVARIYGKDVNSLGQKVHLYMIKMEDCCTTQEFIEEICSECKLSIEKNSKNIAYSFLKRLLNSKSESYLFILDGIQENEAALQDILECVSKIVKDTRSMFFITSTIRICFPRLKDNKYYEHMCLQMMPNYAKRLFMTAAGYPGWVGDESGYPSGFSKEKVEEVIRLTKRVPFALMLAGQKINPSTPGVDFTLQDVIDLLTRSVIDTLTLNFAPKNDQFGPMLKRYFDSLSPDETRFVIRLGHNDAIDHFTLATASEVIPQKSHAEVKCDILEPLVNRSVLSPKDHNPHQQAFESNEWLNDYIKGYVLHFVAGSRHEFVQKITELINTHLNRLGIRQDEVNKVLSTKQEIGETLKVAFFNLIDFDSRPMQMNEPDVQRTERAALHVQVIHASVYFLGNGFHECKPLVFAREALAIMTRMEDERQRGHAHTLNQLARSVMTQKPRPDPEPVAKVSSINSTVQMQQKQPVQQISTDSGSSSVRPLPDVYQEPSIIEPSPPLHLDSNSGANHGEQSLMQQQPVIKHNNREARLSSMSTVADTTRLVRHDGNSFGNSQTTTLQQTSDQKVRHLGTSDVPHSLRSSISKLDYATSAVSQFDDSVFDSRRRYPSGESVVHSLKSNPPRNTFPRQDRTAVGYPQGNNQGVPTDNGNVRSTGHEEPTIPAQYTLAVNSGHVPEADQAFPNGQPATTANNRQSSASQFEAGTHSQEQSSRFSSNDSMLVEERIRQLTLLNQSSSGESSFGINVNGQITELTSNNKPIAHISDHSPASGHHTGQFDVSSTYDSQTQHANSHDYVPADIFSEQGHLYSNQSQSTRSSRSSSAPSCDFVAVQSNVINSPNSPGPLNTYNSPSGRTHSVSDPIQKREYQPSNFQQQQQQSKYYGHPEHHQQQQQQSPPYMPYGQAPSHLHEQQHRLQTYSQDHNPLFLQSDQPSSKTLNNPQLSPVLTSHGSPHHIVGGHFPSPISATNPLHQNSTGRQVSHQDTQYQQHHAQRFTQNRFQHQPNHHLYKQGSDIPPHDITTHQATQLQYPMYGTSTSPSECTAPQLMSPLGQSATKTDNGSSLPFVPHQFSAQQHLQFFQFPLQQDVYNGLQQHGASNITASPTSVNMSNSNGYARRDGADAEHHQYTQQMQYRSPTS